MTGDLALQLPFRVWRIETRQAPNDTDLETITSAEWSRSRRYLRDRDRNSFLKTRAALRRLLGAALGIHPHAIRFDEDGLGKPTVGDNSAAISFSVAHTDELSVIAVSDGRRIGVDVERHRSVPERDLIVEQIFDSSLVRALSGLETATRDAAFLRLWTGAEAVVKATGTGFAGLRNPIPLALDAASGCVRLDYQRASADEHSLTLLPLALPDGFLGAVAVDDLSMPPGASVADLPAESIEFEA